MPRNYYAEAIDYLTNRTLPSDKIVIELAKNHPKILIKILDKFKPQSKDARFNFSDISDYWQSNIEDMIINGCTKIEAIKMCRELTSMGLKEAKDAVELFYTGSYPYEHI